MIFPNTRYVKAEISIEKVFPPVETFTTTKSSIERAPFFPQRRPVVFVDLARSNRHWSFESAQYLCPFRVHCVVKSGVRRRVAHVVL